MPVSCTNEGVSLSAGIANSVATDTTLEVSNFLAF